jgi:hypothetical protein
MIIIIKIIHTLLIFFILFAPFYNKTLLRLSIFLCAGTLYKWLVDGSCILTKLEYIVLNKPTEEEGFIYRLINPIFNMKENNMDRILEYFLFIWLLILIIIYNIY